MSIFDEKVNSLIRTREFLRLLLSPYNGGFKGVPKDVRLVAEYILKHFPSEYEIKIRDDEGKWQNLRDTLILMEKDE